MSASPDEITLVNFASEIGFKYLVGSESTINLSIPAHSGSLTNQ
jgi:hypothetical protein